MKGRILVGVPTRGRPEYLSCLLATLMYQTETEWDLLIADTDTENDVEKDPQVHRFLTTIKALGHRVEVMKVPVVGRSEAVAVNRILTEAFLRDYGYVFKVDDDHTLPPTALRKLKEDMRSLEKGSSEPVLISGVTPWMHEVWDTAASPRDVKAMRTLNGYPTRMEVVEGEVKTEVGHFFRWVGDELPVKSTMLASAANFMMRPDIRLLWSDVGLSSLYADAIWFLQLKLFLGYRLHFDLQVNVWHVAAPTGGVREENGQHRKDSEEDHRREAMLKVFLSLYEEWCN